jgi:hypothetical protein
MATRVQPTAHDADNNVGTACGAARNDWRSADADSMSARDTTIPLQMPDIRLQATTRPAFKPDCLSYLREESIYDLLALGSWKYCPLSSAMFGVGIVCCVGGSVFLDNRSYFVIEVLCKNRTTVGRMK